LVRGHSGLVINKLSTRKRKGGRERQREGERGRERAREGERGRKREGGRERETVTGSNMAGNWCAFYNVG
jgi:hypothetical protein